MARGVTIPAPSRRAAPSPTRRRVAARAAAVRAMTASASGACGAQMAMAPGLMPSAFSAAMAAGVVAGGAQDALQHGGRGALAVGAGDDRERVARLDHAEQLEQAAGTGDVLARALAGRRGLPVGQAVEVAQGGGVVSAEC